MANSATPQETGQGKGFVTLRWAQSWIQRHTVVFLASAVGIAHKACNECLLNGNALLSTSQVGEAERE